MRHRALGIAAGLALGAALATTGISLAPRAEEEASPPTTVPGARSPTVWWHDPHETIVGTAAVILERLTVESDHAVLSYRVEPIASARRSMSLFFPEDEHPVIAPEAWVLETTAGNVHAAARRHFATEVRFPVGNGFSLDSVTGIRLERYRALLPVRFDLELPASPGTSFAADVDTTVTIMGVLSQRSSVIVSVGIGRPEDPFTAGSGRFLIRSLDPRWDEPSGRTPSAEFPDAWQLRFPTPQPPDLLRLEVIGTRWDGREVDLRLDIGGLGRG